jgi:hypothetical protein
VTALRAARAMGASSVLTKQGEAVVCVAWRELHTFIDFGQLCSSKPTGRVHGNRTAVFMISTTCFQAGQHP